MKLETKVSIGHTIHGKGNKKVIALHSWMDDYQTWKPIIPYLNLEDFTFVFMDVRGYGSSKDIQGIYNSDEIANDIFDLADDLNWDKFYLIGHSMTGMAVQKAALKDKENRILKVIAITPVSASGFPVDPDTKSFFKSIIQNEELVKTGLDAFTDGKLNNNWKNYRAKRHLDATNPNAQEGYLEMWVNENFANQTENIEQPFLVISGSNDHPGFRLEAQLKAFEKFKQVAFLNIKSSGHFPMQETPILLATYIENFFSKN